MQGVHAFGPLTGAAVPARSVGVGDQLNIALYLATPGTLTPSIVTTYSPTISSNNEVSGTGYTAGGKPMTVVAGDIVNNSTSGCFSPAASVQWTSLSLGTAFDTALVYNSSQGNKAVSLHNFGSQTITAGTLTLTMPANTAGNALVELA